MAKMNVAPTKSNLLKMKRDLEFAQEGYELLDQKREILVLELMKLVEDAKTAQTDVEERMRAAFDILEKATIKSGTEAMMRNAVAINYDHEIEVSEYRLMGINLPIVRTETAPIDTQFGFQENTEMTDEVMRTFLDALEAISRLAAIETSIWKLARELRKTQRRVNALDKIFIPQYQETIDFINSTLEEKERESFFVLKQLKKKLRHQD